MTVASMKAPRTLNEGSGIVDLDSELFGAVNGKNPLAQSLGEYHLQHWGESASGELRCKLPLSTTKILKGQEETLKAQTFADKHPRKEGGRNN